MKGVLCAVILIGLSASGAEVKSQIVRVDKTAGTNAVGAIETPRRLLLADVLSYLTVHIRSKCDGRPVTGTGFFYNFRFKDGRTAPMLLTNKHVVLGYTETTLRFSLVINGRPSNQYVDHKLRTNECHWYAHPDNDVDLCALPILSIIDYQKQQGRELFISPLDSSFIPSKDALANISQLDDVAMIGYPDGIWDEKNNQPIFRKGVFATSPSKDYNGQKEFVIDMPVYGGSSGSPVLIASDNPFTPQRGNGGIVMNQRWQLKLMGIVYKTFIHNDVGRLVPILIPTGAQVLPAAQMRIPNNLGLVINSSRIKELEEHIVRSWGGEPK